MAGQGAKLGIFSTAKDLLSAVRELRARKVPIQTIYAPVRLDELDEALGLKPSRVRLFTLIGGIVGGTSLVALAVYAHLSFRLITSGKPVIPPIPFVIVFFEGLILLATIFAVASWILKGRLPRIRLPQAYDRRFSEDRFGIVVSPAADRDEEVSEILRRAGAEEVRDAS